MSELLNEISKQRIAIPHLNGSEPLKLLLEIGIEKLFRDYETIFISAKICTEPEFKMFLEGNKNFNGDLNRFTNEENKRMTLRKTLFDRNVKKPNDDLKLVGFQNTRYDEKEINLKLSKLGQLHIILEHLLMAQQQFKMKSCMYNQFINITYAINK